MSDNARVISRERRAFDDLIFIFLLCLFFPEAFRTWEFEFDKASTKRLTFKKKIVGVFFLFSITRSLKMNLAFFL